MDGTFELGVWKTKKEVCKDGERKENEMKKKNLGSLVVVVVFLVNVVEWKKKRKKRRWKKMN